MIVGWFFTIIALIGTLLNSQMNIWGFAFWIVSNTGFLVMNVLTGNYAEAVLFFVNTLVSISGIITWRKKQGNSISSGGKNNIVKE